MAHRDEIQHQITKKTNPSRSETKLTEDIEDNE